uniref:DUF4219 domain-containing protein n=1 Tax=Setaria viridis TaxID=4556 RepID=A0A4U6VPK9_SETVI|nr:hypothetical protein SEVIR_2G124700v2 [Setaria viridis]
MADLLSTGDMRRLNSHNYGYWHTYIESYLMGQELWEAGKAMFMLKMMIEEDLVEHIRDVETPNDAWETLAKLFSKKNEARF